MIKLYNIQNPISFTVKLHQNIGYSIHINLVNLSDNNYQIMFLLSVFPSNIFQTEMTISRSIQVLAHLHFKSNNHDDSYYIWTI